MNVCLKRTARLCTVAALAGLLLLAGCGRTVFVGGGTPTAGTGHVVGDSLTAQADAAWKAGKYLEAERLYNVIARDAALPTGDRALAWERVARAALSSGNRQGAENALNFWKNLVPGAEQSAAWLEIKNQLGGGAASGRAGDFSSGCVALAVPLSGSYGPFGDKIAAGAVAAQGELSKSGIAMDVRLINTESPDWLDKLAQLPPQCVMVGGPLRPDRYAALKARNLQTSRAVFAFRSSLEGSDEGSAAWRFFSSPQDQIDAVLRFGADLGLSGYGVLAPSDAYGQRMADMFLQSARGRGQSVKLATYQAGDTGNWSGVMRDFVGGTMRGKTPVPTTTFQAAFIPDTWDNLELLVPFLFYQGEDRLVLMGTSLWEQGLSSRSSVNVANLDLAIFPGSWDPAASTPAAAALVRAMAENGKGVPDFWAGIGYDFVRFASVMNVRGPWTPGEINSRLSSAQNMEWSMAPIRWSGGKASQKLFIFHPVQTGFELADPAAFKARHKEILARHARRVGR